MAEAVSRDQGRSGPCFGDGLSVAPWNAAVSAVVDDEHFRRGFLERRRETEIAPGHLVPPREPLLHSIPDVHRDTEVVRESPRVLLRVRGRGEQDDAGNGETPTDHERCRGGPERVADDPGDRRMAGRQRVDRDREIGK